VVFIESVAFTRRLRKLAGKNTEDVLNAIQDDLVADPQRGTVVEGLGGIRKARVANHSQGKGKRGGFRYRHLFLERRDHIHLLILLDKDEQVDLDSEQRTALRRMVAELEGRPGANMARRTRAKVFDDLRQSLAYAGVFEQGVRVNLRTTQVPAPPKPLKPAEIRKIRLALNASQTLFARYLNVSSYSVESWEQGVRQPRQATLKLLHIARRNPSALLG
jgi:DNA-binding transcriptional regulator YiaG